MAASAVAPAGFVILERRREAQGVSPLVTMSLFRKRAFSTGLASTLVFFFAGMIGLMLTFLWIEAGVLVVTAGLVALPPKRARETHEH